MLKYSTNIFPCKSFEIFQRDVDKKIIHQRTTTSNYSFFYSIEYFYSLFRTFSHSRFFNREKNTIDFELLVILSSFATSEGPKQNRTTIITVFTVQQPCHTV